MARCLIEHKDKFTFLYLEFNPLFLLSRCCTMQLHFVPTMLGQHFSSNCELHAVTETGPRNTSNEGFKQSFNKWIERSKKCIRVPGEYDEGDEVLAPTHNDGGRYVLSLSSSSDCQRVWPHVDRRGLSGLSHLRSPLDFSVRLYVFVN
jgi:hypothetical protein